MFDTHAHLTDRSFADDRDEVLARADAAGVSRIVVVATDRATSAGAIALAEANPDRLAASVGIHPNSWHEVAPDDWDAITASVNHPAVVALGETGLDRYWDTVPFAVQQDGFDRHLRLAQQTGLPVIIHQRECEADILAMLEEAASRGPIRGVMHSFTGSAATRDRCLELGLMISFAGMVTYKKNQALREIAAGVPRDRLLVETDCPYLSPEPVRSIRRNEPAHVAHTAACLAGVFGLTIAEIDQITTANAARLFTRIER